MRVRALSLKFLSGATALSLALAHGGCRPVDGASAEGMFVALEVDEAMVFEPGVVHCARGQSIRLRLVNRIPAGGPDMPHNFVLLRPGADVDAFARASVQASPVVHYVPTEFATAVLFASPLVAPAHEAEFVFRAPAEPGRYPFVCSFPGHCLLGMTGQLVVH